VNHVDLSDVRIIPQSRFAGLHKGIDNVYFGVPQRVPEYIHHYRSGRSITNIDKLLQIEIDNSEDVLNGNYLYFGAFDYHYGHFISECLGRTWASVHFDFDGILWLPTFHPSHGYEWVRELPAWQNSILSYLGISSDEIYFLTRKAKMSKLIVPESGSWLYTTPENFILDFLKSRQNVYFDGLNCHNSKAKNVFIARGSQYSGRIANVELLYNSVSSQGYEVVFPEMLTFDQQMSLYRDAENIIFEAGSAIHTLELFANLQANVAILPRSQAGSSAFRRILSPRIKKIWNYTGNVEVLNNGRSPRNSDIKVDIDELLRWLHAGKFI
jgi:capsular polysaccharide biosynthesis protein